MCCLDDDCCCCCGGGCYDSLCERCCPCISYDTRETIFGCIVCLLILGAVALFAVLLAAYGFIRHPEVAVESASLTRFALSTSPATAVAYNLSLTLTLRNRNWAMSVRSTQALEADYSFDGQRFDRVRLADAGAVQGAGRTRVYHVVSGADAAYVALGNSGVAEFARENATGAFQLEVALAGEVRYQAHFTRCKLAATCPLTLQLAPPGTPAVVFKLVKCKLAKPDKNC